MVSVHTRPHRAALAEGSGHLMKVRWSNPPAVLRERPDRATHPPRDFESRSAPGVADAGTAPSTTPGAPAIAGLRIDRDAHSPRSGAISMKPSRSPARRALAERAAAAALLVLAPVVSAQVELTVVEPEPTTSCVNGGIGETDEPCLRPAAEDWPLRLVSRQ